MRNEFAFVVNIQGDEPLVDPRLIDKIVEKLRSDRATEIVTAGHRFEHPEERAVPSPGQSGCRSCWKRALFLSRPDSIPGEGLLAVPSSSGHLRFSAERTPAIRKVETHSAGAR